jgi:serine/threonine protein kinase
VQTLPTIGALVAGKYRVEALLGQGGMGAVYRARHELMNSEVALKWLHPNLHAEEGSHARFLREARAAASVRHPHVVTVHDVGEHEGAPFLVMELLRGVSLEALLRRAPLPMPALLDLILQAMRGAAAVHDAGLVHRDIKPDNIFVVEEAERRHAKLVDFGTSKWVGGDRLTRSGAAVGTLEFMSYEQMHGVRDIDARTDVYAFGVVLYYAITGVSPFAGESLAEVALKVVSQDPKAPRELRPELPRALSEAVMKAIARRREQRFASIGAFLDALHPYTRDGSLEGLFTRPPQDRAHTDEHSARTRPLSPTPEPAIGPQAAGAAPRTSAPIRPRSRTRFAGWAATALAAVALAGVLAWATEQRPAREQAAAASRTIPNRARSAASATTESHSVVAPSLASTSAAALPNEAARERTQTEPPAPVADVSVREIAHDPERSSEGVVGTKRTAHKRPLQASARVRPPLGRPHVSASESELRGHTPASQSEDAMVRSAPTPTRREVAEGQRSGRMRRDDF